MDDLIVHSHEGEVSAGPFQRAQKSLFEETKQALCGEVEWLCAILSELQSAEPTDLAQLYGRFLQEDGLTDIFASVQARAGRNSDVPAADTAISSSFSGHQDGFPQCLLYHREVVERMGAFVSIVEGVIRDHRAAAHDPLYPSLRSREAGGSLRSLADGHTEASLLLELLLDASPTPFAITALQLLAAIVSTTVQHLAINTPSLQHAVSNNHISQQVPSLVAAATSRITRAARHPERYFVVPPRSHTDPGASAYIMTAVSIPFPVKAAAALTHLITGALSALRRLLVLVEDATTAVLDVSDESAEHGPTSPASSATPVDFVAQASLRRPAEELRRTMRTVLEQAGVAGILAEIIAEVPAVHGANAALLVGAGSADNAINEDAPRAALSPSSVDGGAGGWGDVMEALRRSDDDIDTTGDGSKISISGAKAVSAHVIVGDQPTADLIRTHAVEALAALCRACGGVSSADRAQLLTALFPEQCLSAAFISSSKGADPRPHGSSIDSYPPLDAQKGLAAKRGGVVYTVDAEACPAVAAGVLRILALLIQNDALFFASIAACDFPATPATLLKGRADAILPTSARDDQLPAEPFIQLLLKVINGRSAVRAAGRYISKHHGTSRAGSYLEGLVDVLVAVLSQASNRRPSLGAMTSSQSQSLLSELACVAEATRCFNQIVGAATVPFGSSNDNNKGAISQATHRRVQFELWRVSFSRSGGEGLCRVAAQTFEQCLRLHAHAIAGLTPQTAASQPSALLCGGAATAAVQVLDGMVSLLSTTMSLLASVSVFAEAQATTTASSPYSHSHRTDASSSTASFSSAAAASAADEFFRCCDRTLIHEHVAVLLKRGPATTQHLQQQSHPSSAGNANFSLCCAPLIDSEQQRLSTNKRSQKNVFATAPYRVVAKAARLLRYMAEHAPPQHAGNLVNALTACEPVALVLLSALEPLDSILPRRITPSSGTQYNLHSRGAVEESLLTSPLAGNDASTLHRTASGGVGAAGDVDFVGGISPIVPRGAVGDSTAAGMVAKDAAAVENHHQNIPVPAAAAADEHQYNAQARSIVAVAQAEVALAVVISLLRSGANRHAFRAILEGPVAAPFLDDGSHSYSRNSHHHHRSLYLSPEARRRVAEKIRVASQTQQPHSQQENLVVVQTVMGEVLSWVSRALKRTASDYLEGIIIQDNAGRCINDPFNFPDGWESDEMLVHTLRPQTPHHDWNSAGPNHQQHLQDAFSVSQLILPFEAQPQQRHDKKKFTTALRFPSHRFFSLRFVPTVTALEAVFDAQEILQRQHMSAPTPYTSRAFWTQRVEALRAACAGVTSSTDTTGASIAASNSSSGRYDAAAQIYGRLLQLLWVEVLRRVAQPRPVEEMTEKYKVGQADGLNLTHTQARDARRDVASVLFPNLDLKTKEQKNAAGGRIFSQDVVEDSETVEEKDSPRHRAGGRRGQLQQHQRGPVRSRPDPAEELVRKEFNAAFRLAVDLSEHYHDKVKAAAAEERRKRFPFLSGITIDSTDKNVKTVNIYNTSQKGLISQQTRHVLAKGSSNLYSTDGPSPFDAQILTPAHAHQYGQNMRTWSVSSVQEGDVFFLSVPLVALTASVAEALVEKARVHEQEARKAFLMTPTPFRERRWFLLDLHRHIIPRTAALLRKLQETCEKHGDEHVRVSLGLLPCVRAAGAEPAINCGNLITVVEFIHQYFSKATNAGHPHAASSGYGSDDGRSSPRGSTPAALSRGGAVVARNPAQLSPTVPSVKSPPGFGDNMSFFALASNEFPPLHLTQSFAAASSPSGAAASSHHHHQPPNLSFRDLLAPDIDAATVAAMERHNSWMDPSDLKILESTVSRVKLQSGHATPAATASSAGRQRGLSMKALVTAQNFARRMRLGSVKANLEQQLSAPSPDHHH